MGVDDGSLCGSYAVEQAMATIPFANKSQEAVWKAATTKLWRGEPFVSHPSGNARTAGGLTYVRVLNSGHLVPTDQPRAALDLMERVVFGQGWAGPPLAERRARVQEKEETQKLEGLTPQQRARESEDAAERLARDAERKAWRTAWVADQHARDAERAADEAARAEEREAEEAERAAGNEEGLGSEGALAINLAAARGETTANERVEQDSNEEWERAGYWAMVAIVAMSFSGLKEFCWSSGKRPEADKDRYYEPLL